MAKYFPVKYLIILVFFGLSELAIGQITMIDSLNVSYPIGLKYTSDSISIEDLQTDNTLLDQFSRFTISTPKLNTIYWATFRLFSNDNLKISRLQFEFPISDATVLYVPHQDGTYRDFSIGLTAHKQICSLKEVSNLTIDAEKINFEAPFFYKTKVLSYYGFRSFLTKPSVIGHHYYPLKTHPSYINGFIQNQYKESLFWVFYGMLMISFIYVCIYYTFHRKKYFLFYALHLLFSLIKFFIYTPYMFNNVLVSEQHYLYSIYGILNSQLASSICYLFFIKYFVGTDNSYKKFAPWYNRSLYIFIAAVLISNAAIGYNPEAEDLKIVFWVLIFFSFFFTLASVTYMFVKKKLTHTSIVFIGLLVYMIGVGVIAFTRTDNSMVLPLLAVETVFFVSVLSYLDLKRVKKVIESEKLQEINDFQRNFYTNITHEFRTPLTLISVPIQERLKCQSLSNEEREEFEMIQRNQNRLLGLVDQLLSLSKLETDNQKLQLQEGDIIRYIEQIWKDFQYQADQKEIVFEMDIDDTISDVMHWFDKDVIEKIISNLVSNACKYTPKKGEIVGTIHIVKGNLLFTIRNTGDGFTKDEYDRVFEQFYQIDGNQPGAGIGLFLIRQLVQLHQGTITVESNPNAFTKFSLDIPIHKNAFSNNSISVVSNNNNEVIADTTSENQLEDNSSIEVKNRPVVLIVEDHQDLRNLLHKILSKNHQVYTASNGEKGIKLAYKYIPDLIISDIMMPVLDGVAMTMTLKNDERTSHIPILLLTAKVGEEHELVGIKYGADDYIEKPFNPEILKYKIQNIFASKERLRKLYQQEKFSDTIIANNDAEQLFWKKVNQILTDKIGDTTFNIEAFSKEMNMSRMTLHRKVKNLTGMSTSEFITNRRLKKACYYLEHTDRTITEIAIDVGFETISYFNKCFKNRYQSTPSTYRKMCLKPELDVRN